MMKRVNQALTDMNSRLFELETTVRQLNDQVADSGQRQQDALDDMRQQADAMRRDAEAMRSDAESMGTAVVRMHREVSRNTAMFDQATAEMSTTLQAYRGDVGIVVEFLVKEKTRHDDELDEIHRRLDALERKLAG